MSLSNWIMRPVKCVPGPLESPCILWTGKLTMYGYGSACVDRKKVNAHRVAFRLRYGYWPEVGRHKCDVRACINPGHVVDGTITDNNRDMRERGRESPPSGESHWASKLSEQDVIAIRGLLSDGVSQPKIAARFNVNRSVISKINTGAAWRHVS